MTTVNVLFELGVEELPAHCVTKFPEQLKNLIATALENQKLSFSNLEVYTTPRRLALYIQNLLAKQPDYVLPIKGPQEKVAFNDKNEPSQAGLGFARKNNIDPTKLKDYVENGQLIYRVHKKGATIQELLPNLLTLSVNSLQAGRTMRWDGAQTFVRPIRWIILLINDKLLETEMFDLKTQNFSFGHRFLCSAPITIKHADDYVSALEKHGNVLVDQERRKQRIIEQLLHLPKKYKGEALVIDDLVNEVNGLVEWPVALVGTFNKDFLQVPAEALISSMKQHQKYFPVRNENLKLMPYFVTISNIESKKPEQVIQGNERVLNARLTDAAFFFNQDKQKRLYERTAQLSSIVYQEQLGSLYNKTERVVKLCEQLAEAWQLDMHDCVRAAWLGLCDLTTTMVQEFPELQGTMGKHYAQHDGETEAVCLALEEQYLPRFAGDAVPATPIGSLLGFAQRLDTLTSQFAIGNKPNGDKDPFALRRCALGLLRILIEKNLDINVKEWVIKSSALLPVNIENKEALAEEVWRFCLDRLRSWHIEQGGDVNYFMAVSSINISNPYDMTLRMQALNQFRQLPAATALIAAHKRVKNILNKTELSQGVNVKKELLKDAPEIELVHVLQEKSATFHRLSQQRDYVALLSELAKLRPHIDKFFDHVMVMVDDLALRENRLALLTELHNYFECVADISELVEGTQ